MQQLINYHRFYKHSTPTEPSLLSPSEIIITKLRQGLHVCSLSIFHVK